MIKHIFYQKNKFNRIFSNQIKTGNNLYSKKN